MFSQTSVSSHVGGVPYDHYPWCIGLHCSYHFHGDGTSVPAPWLLTADGGARNTYGWQAGGTHLTGMLPCFSNFNNWLNRQGKNETFTRWLVWAWADMRVQGRCFSISTTCDCNKFKQIWLHQLEVYDALTTQTALTYWQNTIHSLTFQNFGVKRQKQLIRWLSEPLTETNTFHALYCTGCNFCPFQNKCHFNVTLNEITGIRTNFKHSSGKHQQWDFAHQMGVLHLASYIIDWSWLELVQASLV